MCDCAGDASCVLRFCRAISLDAPKVADVRAAGSFKRYANAHRLDVVVLQALCAKGRAVPPPALERLFPTSTRSQFLPREISWRILSYWRTDRDP